MSSRLHRKPLKPRSRARPPSATFALVLGAAAWGVLGAVPSASAAAEPGKASNPNRYLGVWNYDQPDRDRMTNIAVIRCPDARPDCPSPIQGAPPGTPMQIPQIGWIVFSEEPGGKIVGRTDRGCSYRFTQRPGSLQLDPPSQYCFNHVINSGYTLTRWSVTVSGGQEKETIAGVSHHPTGDYDFELERGARTKAVSEPWLQAATRFAGLWRYDKADPARLINMVAHRSVAPDGSVQTGRSRQQGLVYLSVKPDLTIVARTADGCRWTLAARGNTADLQPPGQVCDRNGRTITMDFWQIASDRQRQSSIMKGAVRRDGLNSSFLLNVGALTRHL